jgi:glycosyltransferase involved in cell wall biosynthesis
VNAQRKVLFLYLGRRGALGRFTLELAQAAREMPELRAIFAISRMSENAGEFGWLGESLLMLDTFDRVMSFATLRNYFSARRRLLDRIVVERVTRVVTLMPHVWTPLLARSIRARGVRYTTIIHDSVSHPGDPTASVIPWLRSEARLADGVVTLSRAVADHMFRNGFAEPAKTRSLFLPDLRYGSAGQAKSWTADRPLRLLFMGRIFRYKGLSLLLDALDLLRSEGIRVHLGVAGAGDIDDVRSRLAALGAEVINRWLDDSEIAPLLERHDAIVLPYIEASQSGVAAVAFGSCMPVIAMPSGGLAEQVIEGRTGTVAADVSAPALADAIRRLATDPALYARISQSLHDTAEERSMRTFVARLVQPDGAQFAGGGNQGGMRTLPDHGDRNGC